MLLCWSARLWGTAGSLQEPPELLQLLLQPPRKRCRADDAGRPAAGPEEGRSQLGDPAPSQPPRPLSHEPRESAAAAAARRGDACAGPDPLGSQHGSSSQAPCGASTEPDTLPLHALTQASQAEPAPRGAAAGPQAGERPPAQPPAEAGAVLASALGTGDVVAARFQAAPAAVRLAACAPAGRGRPGGFGQIAVQPALRPAGAPRPLLRHT